MVCVLLGGGRGDGGEGRGKGGERGGKGMRYVNFLARVRDFFLCRVDAGWEKSQGHGMDEVWLDVEGWGGGGGLWSSRHLMEYEDNTCVYDYRSVSILYTHLVDFSTIPIAR